jgi:hypothetical protein
VVFWESLKDTRPTAPHMSCGSGRANLGPLRILSRSELLKRTSLSDVVGRFCLYGIRLLKLFFSSEPIPYLAVRQQTIGEQSRFYAQET